jgi:hypothetical protein
MPYGLMLIGKIGIAAVAILATLAVGVVGAQRRNISQPGIRAFGGRT